MSFNFGQIGDIIGQMMDSDYIDIRRMLPNIPGYTEIYSNVPCHIVIKSSDNPDPTTIDIAPKITSLRIHMDRYVDIRNDDYIIAKKVSENNEILAVYSGVCGDPAMSQARQYIQMSMNMAGTPDFPITPLPPTNPSIIIITHEDEDGYFIRPNIQKLVEQGELTIIQPTEVRAYTFLESYLDGELQAVPEVVIDNPQAKGHEVLFVYQEDRVPEYFRILVNGLFVQNNGQMAFGYHLFRRTFFDVLYNYGNGRYQIQTKINQLNHPEMGNIKLTIGTIIKIFTTEEWAIIDSNLTQQGDVFIFDIKSYIPTPEEENAVIYEWADI